jgi:hypothetical protein
LVTAVAVHKTMRILSHQGEECGLPSGAACGQLLEVEPMIFPGGLGGTIRGKEESRSTPRFGAYRQAQLHAPVVPTTGD